MPAWLIPAAISGISALYSATRKSPKTPKYQPSQWETDYYNRLRGILEGTDTSFNLESQYQLAKDKLLPEYERLRKEGNINLARRNIEGGPQVGLEQSLATNQYNQLANLRRELQGQLENLRYGALQGMGQLGTARSQAEYGQRMADFQARMAQYQETQNALAGLIGTGANMAYDMYGSQSRPYSSKTFGIQPKLTNYPGLSQYNASNYTYQPPSTYAQIGIKPRY